MCHKVGSKTCSIVSLFLHISVSGVTSVTDKCVDPPGFFPKVGIIGVLLMKLAIVTFI